MLLLSRLKKAVKKVTLLLNLNAYRFRIASMMIGGRSPRVSFKERPGLACASDEYNYYSASEGSGSSRGQIQRTTSYDPSDQDSSDIDLRADMFIANFRRQLQMERQISLEVRFYSGNSFDYWRSP